MRLTGITKKLTIMIAVLVISACSTPPKVVAKVDLVKPADFRSDILTPESEWLVLAESTVSQEIMIEGTLWRVGDRYVSALGHSCIELAPTDLQSVDYVRQVVCQPPNEKYWYRVQPLSHVK